MTQHKMGLWKFVALSRQPINIVNNLVILIASGSKISSQQPKLMGSNKYWQTSKRKNPQRKLRNMSLPKKVFGL